MPTLLHHIRSRWGVDAVIVSLFSAALLLYGLAWWLRQSVIRFNITVFEIAGGILVLNLAFTSLSARKEVTIGYLLAGAALAVQLLLLILLWKANAGTLS